MQMQLQLHYITQHYATLITLHYITLRYATLHLQLQLRNTTTLHYTTLHYTNYTSPQLQLQLRLHHATLITLHYNYSSTTIQLQLRYTTLHPSSCGEVTTATIAATPNSTTSTTFGSISGFALPCVIHNNQLLLYRFPIFETSATALCGTTGIRKIR